MGYRDIPIVIRPSVDTVKIPAAGEVVEVEVDKDGNFRGRYRTENLWGSAKSIRSSVERMEAEAAERKERVKRLKAAETDPVPAMLFVPPTKARGATRGNYRTNYATIPGRPAQPARLERVGIRGIDKRSREALILRADGSRESMRWDRLLRPLSAEQQHDLLDLLKALDDARDAVPEPLRFEDAAEALPPLELVATYDDDPEVEGWLVQHDGETFFADGHRPFDVLQNLVAAHEIAKTYPWAEDENKIKLLSDVVRDRERSYFTSVEVFKTKAEGEAYLAAGERVDKASKAFEAALKRLAFDKKRFTEDET